MYKTDDFSTVVLYKNEFKTLKDINKKGALLVMDRGVSDALLSHNFVETVQDLNKHIGLLSYNSKLCISDRGKRYLIYLRKCSRPSLVEWIRYGITTFIAIAALVISLVK